MSQNCTSTEHGTDDDTPVVLQRVPTVRPKKTRAAGAPKGVVKRGVKRPLRRVALAKLTELSTEFARRLDNHKLSVVCLEKLVTRYMLKFKHRQEDVEAGASSSPETSTVDEEAGEQGTTV